MLGGSSGGRVEGLNENGENERKKEREARRGGALCFLPPRSSPSALFSFSFFLASLFFPLATSSLFPWTKVISYARQTPALEQILLAHAVFLDRSYLYNRLL